MARRRNCSQSDSSSKRLAQHCVDARQRRVAASVASARPKTRGETRSIWLTPNLRENPRRSGLDGLLARRRRRPSEERKRALPVPPKPFRGAFSVIFGLIVVVPGAVERRQRLGGNRGSRAVGTVRRRIATDGESRFGRDSENGGEADQSARLETWDVPQSWIVPVLHPFR